MPNTTNLVSNDLFNSIHRLIVIMTFLFLYLAAKPLHHHGQDCLRLRVDVVANDGEYRRPCGL